MQASNGDPRQVSGRDQYRRKRRDALDRIVDRELRRERRCQKIHGFLVKLGLAVLTGVVPALIAAFAGWIDKLSDFVSALIHGGAPR